LYLNLLRVLDWIDLFPNKDYELKTTIQKRRMGNELKKQILVHDGIIAEQEIQKKPSVLVCSRCNQVNAIDIKFCIKCSYPLTPEAYDEIKAEEDRKFQVLREKQQEKDEQLKAVNQQVNMMQSQMQALITTLGNMDETSKNSFAKQLFQNGLYKKD
jgi:ribosomal protein L40E